MSLTTKYEIRYLKYHLLFIKLQIYKNEEEALIYNGKRKEKKVTYKRCETLFHF